MKNRASDSLIHQTVIFTSTFLMAVTYYDACAIAYASINPVQIQTDIDATNVFNTGKMVLGDSIKRLVILIPNEAHEVMDGVNEPRHYPQPFIPQDPVVFPGTEVVWFNGDIDHTYDVIVTNANNKTYVPCSPEFGLQVSNPCTFSQVGKHNYAITNVDSNDLFSPPYNEPRLMLNGTITVVDRRTNDTSARSIDTIGALMVPAKDTQSMTMNLTKAGFGIHSIHEFQDLCYKGVCSMQALIIWTANGIDLNKIESTLQAVSKVLPYE